MQQNELLQDKRDFRRLRYAPGNMTQYDLVAVKLGPPDQGGGWVVSCLNFGCCMQVHEGQYLSTGYIAEKMKSRIGTFGDSDLVALRDGIHKLME